MTRTEYKTAHTGHRATLQRGTCASTGPITFYRSGITGQLEAYRNCNVYFTPGQMTARLLEAVWLPRDMRRDALMHLRALPPVSLPR